MKDTPDLEIVKVKGQSRPGMGGEIVTTEILA